MTGGLQKKKRDGAKMKEAKSPKAGALPGKKKKRATAVAPIKGYK